MYNSYKLRFGMFSLMIIQIFLLTLNTFLQASSIEISNPQYSLVFGTFTSVYDSDEKRHKSDFKQETVISLEKAEWDLIKLKDTVQSDIGGSTFLPFDSQKLDSNVFQEIVLPIMKKPHWFPNDQYYQKVLFYNSLKDTAGKYNYLQLKGAFEFASLCQLPVFIEKILFNLCYDKKQGLEELLKSQKCSEDQKREIQQGIKFLQDHFADLIISIKDIPEREIKNKFIDFAGSISKTIDFSRQGLRSLQGITRIISEGNGATVNLLRKQNEHYETRLNFQGNCIQDLDQEFIDVVEQEKEIVVDLKENPLSPEAKKTCKEINGQFKTFDEFKQHFIKTKELNEKREELRGRLKIAGHATEGLLMLASLFGLWKLNTLLSNQLIQAAKKGFPSSLRYIKKIAPWTLASIATVTSGAFGGPFNRMFGFYRFLNTYITRGYSKFIPSMQQPKQSHKFIIYDQ